MLEKSLSHRCIAKALGRSQSSISREIASNTKFGKKYIPFYAQKRADRVGKNQRYKAPLKSPEIFLFVREHLRKPHQWSPETISGSISKYIPGASISTEAIYQYIYKPKNKKANLSKNLTCKHQKRRHQLGRSVHKSSKIPNAISIDNRPKYIRYRKQVGHWESDLMEGPRSSKTVLSVTTERSTRFTLINRLVSKKAIHKEKHIIKRLKKLPAQLIRTLTLDNGSENSNHTQISKKLRLNVFFCHPYHSWEKGTVENTIGRIRRYIPKGTDLTPISDERISELEYILNNTPRKCLGYLTPYEKMCQVIRKIESKT